MKTFASNCPLNRIITDLADPVELIEQLHDHGYQQIFELVGNKLVSHQTGGFFYPREFHVDQHIQLGELAHCYAVNHLTEEIKGIYLAF